MDKISVCVIGNGNWSTAIAKVIAENVLKLEDVEDKVNMYVYEETFEGKRMSDIINQEHVNPKYLPNVPLPKNLVACADLVETAKYADVIVFAIPSKHIEDFCKTLLGKLKPKATALALIKGFIPNDSGGMELISHTITKYLKITCAVLTGVNLPNEIIANHFCESTIGCRDAKLARLLKELLQTKLFRVILVDDSDTVEACSLLRHIITFGVGLLDGLDCNENIKSALLRLGLLETMQFTDIFYPGCKFSTFFETCGVSDLITSCFDSRNRRIAEAFVRTGYTIELLEASLLTDEKLLGPLVACAVNCMLQLKGVQTKFPIFTQVYKICTYSEKPSEIINCIMNTPHQIFHPISTLPM